MCTLKRKKLLLINKDNFSSNSTSINNIISDKRNYQNNKKITTSFRKIFRLFMCTTEKSPSKMANAISSMKNYIRNAVSKQRRRYTENGYNLDLAYICDNIIAMGYPAENLEGIYRNRIDDVYQFLEETHQDHYKIYNLCSERSYDKNKFHGRVAIYPFADHNPPTIELIQKFCDDIDRWLTTDDSNVAAVHCKAGKGRTGTMICCYLLHCSFAQTADDALCYYDEKRTKDKKGVTIPSQRRYVEYYSKLIRSRLPYHRQTLQLCKIRFSSAPLVQSQGTVLCSVSTLKDPSCPETVQTLQTFTIDFRKTQSIEIKDRIELTGDVRIELYQKVLKMKKFHFWFNTYFINEEAVREGEGDDVKLICEFKKCELDAHKDKEHKVFAEDFTVQLILHPISSRNMCTCNCTGDLMTSSQNNHNNHDPQRDVILQQQQQQKLQHQQYNTNTGQNNIQNHKTNRSNHNNGSSSSFELELEQNHHQQQQQQQQQNTQNFMQLYPTNNLGNNTTAQHHHQQQQQHQQQKSNKLGPTKLLYDTSISSTTTGNATATTPTTSTTATLMSSSQKNYNNSSSTTTSSNLLINPLTTNNSITSTTTTTATTTPTTTTNNSTTLQSSSIDLKQLLDDDFNIDPKKVLIKDNNKITQNYLLKNNSSSNYVVNNQHHQQQQQQHQQQHRQSTPSSIIPDVSRTSSNSSSSISSAASSSAVGEDWESELQQNYVIVSNEGESTYL